MLVTTSSPEVGWVTPKLPTTCPCAFTSTLSVPGRPRRYPWYWFSSPLCPKRSPSWYPCFWLAWSCWLVIWPTYPSICTPVWPSG